MTIVAFTIDVESDCPPFLTGYRGIEEGMPRLLALLRSRGVPATFFTTGDVAERYPRIVERVVDDGHELGSHGMTHRRFPPLPRDAARDEIERSAAVLRRFAPVTSFRAPHLEFPHEFVDLLETAGFTLDSSQARYKRAYYRDRRHARRSSVTRIPASVTSSALRLPSTLRSMYLAAQSDPVVLFVHPWEFVDLRRERLRIDCRFKTGEVALGCIDAVLRRYASRGARFVRMRELAHATKPRSS